MPRTAAGTRVMLRDMRGSASFVSATSRAQADAASAVFAPGANSWALAWWHFQYTPSTVSEADVYQSRPGVHATNGALIALVSGNVGGLSFYINGAPELYGSDKFIQACVWQRIVCVIDRVQQKILTYANGALTSTSGVLAITDITGVLQQPMLGATVGSLVCLRADVQLCIAATPVALADVQADYHNSKQLPGCVARWPLDDLAGVTAREVVGNRAMTLAGGAVFSSVTPLVRRTAVT